MKEFIKNLIEKFEEIIPEDDEPINMAIMELDEEYQTIQKLGLNNLNKELNKLNYTLINHNEYPDGIKLISMEKC